MAATIAHRHKFLINDLSTRSVILYPSKAQITRELENVELRPGHNEIEIYGLTPTADEHSIKFDGIGAAAITDMTVALVPNSDSFEDTFPSDNVDDSDSDVSSDEEDAGPAVKAFESEIKALQARLERATETQESALRRLEMLNSYCDTLNAAQNDSGAAVQTLATYREQRGLLHGELEGAVEDAEEAGKSLARKEKQLHRATTERRAQRKKEERRKAEARDKLRREQEEKVKEKRRVREERSKFWPRSVYKVTLHLESSVDTPGSSRRSSFSSVTLAKSSNIAADIDAGIQSPADARTISLSMSYVTTEASWVPRYDVSLFTPSKSGTVTYRAEFKNETSETWKDASISLSTSQASFRGLDDAVPSLNAWHIQLGKRHGYEMSALRSPEEQNAMSDRAANNVVGDSTTRVALFGAPSPQQPPAICVQQTEMQQSNLIQQSNANTPNSHALMALYKKGLRTGPARTQPSLFGHLASRAGSAVNDLFRMEPPQASQPAQTQTDQQQIAKAQAHAETLRLLRENINKVSERGERLDSLAAASPPPRSSAAPLESPDSTPENHGLTTTYELPGQRTLGPSSLTRRHKIASLRFTDLSLTSTCVPKLRAAAFLRARFRNPSGSLTLLPGTAGLTLDGAFLGTTAMPRVAPGELVALPLGVDAGVQVSYGRPGVKRSVQGVFSKESAQVFSRSVVVSNSKAVPVEVLVLDQVPVSEDERLRVEILEPNGLVNEGDAVAAGVGEGRKGEKGSERWGTAIARLEKDGRVAWDVQLQKGQACRLVLEYETRAPGTELVVSK